MIYSGKTLFWETFQSAGNFFQNRIDVYFEVKNLENKCSSSYVYYPKHNILMYIEDEYSINNKYKALFGGIQRDHFI